MARRLLFLFVALALVACGQVITIQLPGGPRAAAVPKKYELLFSSAPHAFRYSVPGEPVRRGDVSERFELRDGDCGGSDCQNFRYRSEIKELNASVKARLGKDIWYGWSFYNENIGSVTRDRALGTVIGQWKMAGDQPPIFRIVQTPLGDGDWATCDPAVCNRVADPALDVVVGLEDMSIAANWGAAQNFGNICKLFSMEQNRGKWVDIVVNTNFAADPNGYLRVWINGELKCNYYGQLVSPAGALADVIGPSHRRGIFASYTKRWAEKLAATPKPTMVVFYDEFLVGASRDLVDTRQRELEARRPKD